MCSWLKNKKKEQESVKGFAVKWAQPWQSLPGACAIGHALEKAAQGGAGITTSVSVPKAHGCDTWGHGLGVNTMVSDSMVLEVFSNINNIMIWNVAISSLRNRGSCELSLLMY